MCTVNFSSDMTNSLHQIECLFFCFTKITKAATELKIFCVTYIIARNNDIKVFNKEKPYKWPTKESIKGPSKAVILCSLFVETICELPYHREPSLNQSRFWPSCFLCIFAVELFFKMSYGSSPNQHESVSGLYLDDKYYLHYPPGTHQWPHDFWKRICNSMCFHFRNENDGRNPCWRHGSC